LLVQVDIDNREIYAAFLRNHGFLPIPVKTASDALTVAPHVDVIVTEALLPGQIDGIEFISRLKPCERTKTIPVIVLTACAWREEHERAENAGCDTFLTKPCLPQCCEKWTVFSRPHISATCMTQRLNELADHRWLPADSTLLKGN
jgi:CheY-like chemotaxis protein